MYRYILFFLFTYSISFGQRKSDNIINNYKDSIANFKPVEYIWLTQLGIIYRNSFEYDSAQKYLHKSLLKASKENNKKQESYIFNQLGILFFKIDRLDSSTFYYTKAKELYSDLNDLGNVASINVNLGINYKNSGLYEKALQHLFDGIGVLKKLGKPRLLSSAYNSLAVTYKTIYDYENALDYHKKALKIRLDLNNKKLIASSYNNIGIVFRKTEMYDSALDYYTKSLSIRRELNDQKKIGSNLNNIARVYIDLHEYGKAKSHLFESIEIKSKLNDLKGKAITLNNLGRLYISQFQPSISLKYLNEASNILDSLKILQPKEDNLSIKLAVYKMLNDNQNALSTAEELLIVRDSLLATDKYKRLVDQQAAFEVSSVQQQISLLRQEKALQVANLKLRRTWIIGLAAGILLLLIIGLLVANLWKREKNDKEKKEILLQELNHRIKNNLQLLLSLFNAQSRKIVDKNALKAVKSGENRLSAMAIIHQNLYNQKGNKTINVRDYLTQLIRQLAESFDYDIEYDNITIDIDSFEIDTDKMISIGLIVNELVSNTFKYSFDKALVAGDLNDAAIDTDGPSDQPKSRLSVTVKKSDGYMQLEIKDNGPGFDKKSINKDAMGLNIIEMLGTQLKAKVKWETENRVLYQLKLAMNNPLWKR